MQTMPSRLAACLVGLGLSLAALGSASAALIMRIDAANDLFYMEGSDTGAGDHSGPTYDVQFYYGFSTQPSATATITNTPQNLFVQGTTLPIFSGGMNMIRGNPNPNYVFMDLSALSDITTLTGKGPTETVSYAGLPPADQALFESMIGQSMSLTIGTGYSPISVQAVPEPAGLALTGAALALAGWTIRRRPAGRLGQRRF